MMDCLFKGRMETCLICTYYFACRARGVFEREQNSQQTKNQKR